MSEWSLLPPRMRGVNIEFTCDWPGCSEILMVADDTRAKARKSARISEWTANQESTRCPDHRHQKLEQL